MSQAIVKTVDITVRELTARFQNLLGSNKDENAHDAVSSFRIFHHDTWPNCKRAILEFGIQEIEVLCNWFKTPLLAAGCNIEAVPAEWRQLKVVVSTVPPTRMVTSTRAYALRVNFVTRAYFF